MSRIRRRNRISGQWSARLFEMLDSPARALWRSAHLVISRIEVERPPIIDFRSIVAPSTSAPTVRPSRLRQVVSFVG